MYVFSSFKAENECLASAFKTGRVIKMIMSFAIFGNIMFSSYLFAFLTVLKTFIVIYIPVLDIFRE